MQIVSNTKCQTLFSVKNEKKNITNLSPAEWAKKVVKVNLYHGPSGTVIKGISRTGWYSESARIWNCSTAYFSKQATVRNQQISRENLIIGQGHREPILSGLISELIVSGLRGSHFIQGRLWLVNNKDELIILNWRKECLFVILWLFQRNKWLRLCLLEPKEVVKFQNFSFWYLSIEGLLHIHSAFKNSQRALVLVVFFRIHFAVLSLVFKLKHSLGAQPSPEKMLNYQNEWN